MNVLVTGGAGFIGSHLCRRRLDRGDRVVVMDDFNDFYDPALKRANVAQFRNHPGFRMVEGDIRDRALVFRTFGEERFDSVLHLAARAGVRRSRMDGLSCEARSASAAFIACTHAATNSRQEPKRLLEFF